MHGLNYASEDQLVPAREKLAKGAGSLSGHSGLRLQIEGCTDSVRTDEYNQTLSAALGSSVSNTATCGR
ncbi:MAG: hypothetical protein ABI824_20135, partial [Acidobacteriota bacterium]